MMGLTPLQADAVRVLAELPPDASLAAIGVELGISRSQVARVLGMLRERGWLKGRQLVATLPDHEDVPLEITPAGQAYLAGCP